MSEHKLIRLSERKYVNTAAVAKLERCGNYWDVHYLDGRMEMIWDEDNSITAQLAGDTKKTEQGEEKP